MGIAYGSAEVGFSPILGVSSGDRLSFIVDGNEVRVVNSAQYAMSVIQDEMEGAAQEAGLSDEESVVEFVAQLRSGTRRDRISGH